MISVILYLLNDRDVIMLSLKYNYENANILYVYQLQPRDIFLFQIAHLLWCREYWRKRGSSWTSGWSCWPDHKPNIIGVDASHAIHLKCFQYFQTPNIGREFKSLDNPIRTHYYVDCMFYLMRYSNLFFIIPASINYCQEVSLYFSHYMELIED